MPLTQQIAGLERAEKLRMWRQFAAADRDRRRLGLPAWNVLDSFDSDPVGFVRQGLGQCLTDSWFGWIVVLKAAFGLPLDAVELKFFRQVAGDRDPPQQRVKELWLVIGRRAGKDSFASMVAVNLARYARTELLRPGELGIVACMANDRVQANIVHGYIRGYFEQVPALRRWVKGELPDRPGTPLTLINNTEIRVTTANYRAPRGYTMVAAILDECAFWPDELTHGMNSAEEVYRALRPALGTLPGAMMIGITTAYRKKGLVYEKWRESYGANDDEVLVILAPTTTFNPLFNKSQIDKELRDDPQKAAAEWLSQWREDLADYVQREVVDAAIASGVREREPQLGVSYLAFVDPSGGSRDSFTAGIGHYDSRRKIGVLDYLKEIRAPFAPREAVKEISDELKRYRVSKVKGDHYAGEWPSEAFGEQNIRYELSELVKSDIYREFLPLLNSKRVDLLDHPRMAGQLCSLERRTIRGGRDKIDHPTGADVHDDLANVTAGVLLEAAGKGNVIDRWNRAYAD